MTPLEIKRVVAALIAAFPSTKASDATVVIYERMLGDLDYVVANAAVERLLATSRFMPTVAEIREACVLMTSGDRRIGGEAWGGVLDAVRRFGAYRSPGKDFEFSDELTGRCVAALGWQELCLSENQIADRARFIELYDQLSSQTRTREIAGDMQALKRLHAARPELAKVNEPKSAARAIAAYLELSAPSSDGVRISWCASCDGPRQIDDRGCQGCLEPAASEQ